MKIGSKTVRKGLKSNLPKRVKAPKVKAGKAAIKEHLRTKRYADGRAYHEG